MVYPNGGLVGPNPLNGPCLPSEILEERRGPAPQKGQVNTDDSVSIFEYLGEAVSDLEPAAKPSIVGSIPTVTSKQSQ